MRDKGKAKSTTVNDYQRFMGGLYLITLAIVSAIVISVFTFSQSAQSIIILYAMALTFALSVALLIVSKQPEISSENEWIKLIIVSISTSLVANLIWYLLFYFLSGSRASP